MDFVWKLYGNTYAVHVTVALVGVATLNLALPPPPPSERCKKLFANPVLCVYVEDYVQVRGLLCKTSGVKLFDWVYCLIFFLYHYTIVCTIYHVFIWVLGQKVVLENVVAAAAADYRL